MKSYIDDGTTFIVYTEIEDVGVNELAQEINSKITHGRLHFEKKRKESLFVPWKLEKFKDDTVVYMICPKCNNAYSTHKGVSSFDVRNIFNFCPNCGKRRWNPHLKPNIIKNRRHLYPVHDWYSEEEETED